MMAGTDTILVVGSAGAKAGLVVPSLAAHGGKVRALIRRPEQERAVRAAGASEVAIGDLRDKAGLARAMDGVAGVFYIAPAFQLDEIDLGLRAVAAAVDAGVRRFVFSAVIHPTIGAMANHANKVPVEEAILESGLEYVILQPAMFFQTLAAFWPVVVGSGVFAEPWSTRSRLSRVDFRDVAEAVALAFMSDRLLYGTFQLAAPGWYDRHDIAALMSDVLGTEIRAEQADATAAASAMGSGPQAEGRKRMFAWYDKHSALGSALPLTSILGREPRSLKSFIAELATRG